MNLCQSFYQPIVIGVSVLLPSVRSSSYFTFSAYGRMYTNMWYLLPEILILSYGVLCTKQIHLSIRLHSKIRWYIPQYTHGNCFSYDITTISMWTCCIKAITYLLVVRYQACSLVPTTESQQCWYYMKSHDFRVFYCFLSKKSTLIS